MRKTKLGKPIVTTIVRILFFVFYYVISNITDPNIKGLLLLLKLSSFLIFVLWTIETIESWIAFIKTKDIDKDIDSKKEENEMKERLQEEILRRLSPEIREEMNKLDKSTDTYKGMMLMERQEVGLARVLSVLWDDIYYPVYTVQVGGISIYVWEKGAREEKCLQVIHRQLLDSSGNEMGLFEQSDETIEAISVLLGYKKN